MPDMEVMRGTWEIELARGGEKLPKASARRYGGISAGSRR
jgi:hypothetical protein